MSNCSEFSEAASANKKATSAEEISFSKTCNRLREYLKENGSLGDVNLRIALSTDNGFGISQATDLKSAALPHSLSSMNLFPQGSVKAGVEDVSKVCDYRCVTMEPKKSQMTIFYGGQVMVFNDMPKTKAMEVMRLANISGVQASTHTPAIGLGVMPNESITKISKPVLGEIPIARKQSLARFLEKRKDRILARSPYSANNLANGAISAAMPADKSWLGLAAS